MGLQPLEIFLLLQLGDQISKVYPRALRVKTLKYFCITHGDQEFFHLNTYIINIFSFSAGIDFTTDVRF